MSDNPILCDLKLQSIRRLDRLATIFMKKRMFALEDLCQKIMDINRKSFLLKCNQCGYEDYIEWHFNTANECRECYHERVWEGYISFNKILRSNT